MRIIDPGHIYELDHLDGPGKTILDFVKREGRMYPGNVGHHEGTNMQEVLRALIHRSQYVFNQLPYDKTSDRTLHALHYMREAFIQLELRAAERHGRRLDFEELQGPIETIPTCPKCGHICCPGTCH